MRILKHLHGIIGAFSLFILIASSYAVGHAYIEWQNLLTKPHMQAEENNQLLLICSYLMILIVFVGYGIYACLSVYYYIGKPLKQLAICTLSLADGNTRINLSHTDRQDEIGDISRSLIYFVTLATRHRRLEEENARDVLRKEQKQQYILHNIEQFREDVALLMQQLSEACLGLQETANGMDQAVSQAKQNASVIAAASEEAASSVHSVAGASGQVSNSISQLSEQIQLSQEMITRTMEEASESVATASSLKKAADEIGEVADFIEGVARQIDLLALNATIVSARAGEAGKSFAVVAGEVKNLAQLTTNATKNIEEKISSLLAASSLVERSTGDMRRRIGAIENTTHNMALAVKQQSSASDEITYNMDAAAKGVSHIAENVHDINRQAANASHTASYVKNASSSLTEQAIKLQDQINSFLDNVAHFG
ncbi:MAG: methyl-accepting chemotaxis protein [Alphaproteobacteria bacterium]